MTKNKHKVIAVFGPGLVSDKRLMKSLKKEFKVINYQEIDSLISKLDKLNVSAVLLEIEKGDVDIKLLKKVKARYSNIPIIALGEGGQKELIAKAFQLGACDFFKAPSKVDLLVEKIKSL